MWSCVLPISERLVQIKVQRIIEGSKGKRFFFEKKNQKTFDSAVARSPERTATAALKAFCFFFSKKKRLLA